MTTLDSTDELALRARPSVLVYIGSGALSIAGVVVAIAGLQLILFGRPSTIPIGLFIAAQGLAGAVLGGMMFRARAWAAFAGLGVSLVMALFFFVWNLYSLLTGLLLPLHWFAGLFAFAAMIAVPFALPASIRISQARRQLWRV